MLRRNLAPEFLPVGLTDPFCRQPFRSSLPGEFDMDLTIADGFTDLIRGTDSSVGAEDARAAQASKLAEAGIAPDHLYDASLPQNQALTILVQGDKL